MGKRENAGYQHFLLFPQCFQKPPFSGSLTVWTVWKSSKYRQNHTWKYTFLPKLRKSADYSCSLEHSPNFLLRFDDFWLNINQYNKIYFIMKYHQTGPLHSVNKRAMMALNRSPAMMALYRSPESVSPQNEFYLLYYYCCNL